MTYAHILPKNNVVVHEEGHAALFDFGLSRMFVSGQSKSSERQYAVSGPTGFIPTNLGGTLRYFALEQVLNENSPSTETDMYALGGTYAKVSILISSLPYFPLKPTP